ncbi:venom protease [Aphis gossypii]|uniref:CLIP domain-containing serine protease n=1 Tax=Aphis gossypii TaxID=80765 RepID=A0A291C3B4_APHGO|nr:venom protease [Aphis gossypii]XP_050054379.1 venom protease [Aphis gossypii]ATF27964.1 venom protein [Aphis gossypii]CAH1710302.1 unnamed protein product [Aphis gossypii]
MDKCKFIICIVFVFSQEIGRRVEAQSNNECFTPNDLNGSCINIKSCPPLRTLLETQRTNSTVVTFLRNSMCGYEGKDPKVCCPLDNEPSNNPDTTQRITTSRPDSSGSTVYETVTSIKLPSQKTCGRSNSSHVRIVGGNPAELGAWPWMTALGYRDLNRPNSDYQWLCGGTLISERYVITAAHCTVGIGNRKLAVAHLGDLNLDPTVDDGSRPIDIPITRVITHEKYNAQEFTNDIALLKLENNVRFNQFIQPICLPILSHHRANKLVKSVPFVAGWGATSFRGPSSTTLMEIQIPVLDNSECKRAFANKKAIIDDRVMCAGFLTGGKDACQGDSGGPLMWPNGNQYYLVGVVSFGFKCAEPGYPGVYTRVSSFVEWIADNMNYS